jgi:signal peptidase I
MAEVVFWLVLLGVQITGSVLALRLATPLVGLARLDFLRATLTVGAFALVTAGFAWLGRIFDLGLVLFLSLILLVLCIACFVALRLIARLSAQEALRGMAIIAAGAVVIGGGELVAIRLATAAYVIPTNAMAPTIKGRHFQGICIHCKSDTVVSAVASLYDEGFEPGTTAICTQCYQVAKVSQVAKVAKEGIRMGDRVIVNRLAKPRRWDLAVLYHPSKPEVYVKRLVGLPGEEIEIRDGSIFINGEKMTPPADAERLKWYEPSDGDGPPFAPETYAIRGQSLQLEENQYFMLGDNSPNSWDSRYWGPVPEENLVGVVDCIYFPPRSWRVFPRH